MKIGNIDIERPVILAPMEDVTDRAFRQLCKRHGADIVYTEFISAEALRRGIEKSVRKLRADEVERPIAVQIFGNTVESMVEAAQIARDFSPDYLDINFGCPTKKVAGKGAGAALLREPEKMADIASAVVRAVNIPVTAKTRIGWDHESINIIDVVRRLEDAGIQAIAIHGRTRSDMYRGRADWNWIRAAREQARVPVIANGDIWTAEDALAMFETTQADGVMIGRGSIGNPFIFSRAKRLLATGSPGPLPDFRERIQAAMEHLELSVKFKGEKYGTLEMRRHYSTYLKGLPKVSAVRNKLVREERWEQVIDILLSYRQECEGYAAEGRIHCDTEYLNDHSDKLVLNYQV
ncbi:MAG: tRNA dihydrouridine synthase DusB [Chlorobiaceae bacterium]|nr:tRNA dihydrouridine synthase DusB [Chlorobiaceae bacterium]NTW11330.1 tRNA dihydrouridine synthase DusB [Chlorobiaceae bacterium]